MAQEIILSDEFVAEPLTRFARITRLTRTLLFGAILNGIVALLVMIVALIAGSNSDVLVQVQQILFSGFGGRADAATMILVLLCGLNASFLLMMMIGVYAQEFWIYIAGILGIVLNGALLLLLGFLPALITIATLIVCAFFIRGDWRAFRRNPVMIKELRGRMRGVRAFAIITVYLTLMGGFTILLYLIDPWNSVVGTAVTGELGRVLFISIVAIEMILIIFIVPALTSGAISGERERKTYDLLQTTLLTPASFIVGKLESAMGFIVILLFAAIPLQSIAFLFGGVSETELVLAFVCLIVTAIVLGSIGLFFSSQTERTLSATIRSYAVTLLIAFGAPLLASFLLGGAYSNALIGVPVNWGDGQVAEVARIYIDMIAVSLNPITAMRYSQQILIDYQQAVIVNVTLDSGGQIPVLSPWIILVVIYLITSAILLRLAILRMRRVREGD